MSIEKFLISRKRPVSEEAAPKQGDDGVKSRKEARSEESWRGALELQTGKPYWKKLNTFVTQEIAAKTIYPPKNHIFRALNSLPLEKVKDPYHGPGQAEGWSFSVPIGIKVPSSLQNMYKELQNDLKCTIPRHGHLEKWVHQGVLLLNTCLSVEAHKANSHANKGWEVLTDEIISQVSQKRKGLVFLLWGKHAQKRKASIRGDTHTILEAAHPSGLSAHRGFFGCKHFSKCNQALEKRGLSPIDWQIT